MSQQFFDGPVSDDGADARRYRWLKAHAQTLARHADGTAYWRLPSMPLGSYPARSLDAAIDAALVAEALATQGPEGGQ
jgi:hypothetical protein